jgi:hypothetical protein
MRYNNLFTRVAKGIDDNDPNTPKKKENKVCNDDLAIDISSNTQRQQTEQGKEGKVQLM